MIKIINLEIKKLNFIKINSKDDDMV